MRVEVSIDRNLSLPAHFEQRLHSVLSEQLNRYFDAPSVLIKRGANGFSVSRATKEERERVEEILQEVWESADEWLEE
ncbi:DinI-like family protein [Plesiomonas shigelloides]|uniref:DinI-like family protein n=1 Tax=Plesiomonas shigelloides TaxID=703 RepID=UPI00351CEEB0